MPLNMRNVLYKVKGDSHIRDSSYTENEREMVGVLIIMERGNHLIGDRNFKVCDGGVWAQFS